MFSRRLFSVILLAAGSTLLVGCPIPTFDCLANSTPTANAGPDQIVWVGDLVRLNGLASGDPNGDSPRCLWQPTMRPASDELDNPDTSTPSFVPTVEGVYEFTLTVTDTCGASDQDAVRVVAVAYECEDDAVCDDGEFCNGAETCVDHWCVDGTAPCGPDQVCDEESDQCVDCLEDAHCDDDLFCNGEETCVDHWCVDGTAPCDPDQVCDEESGECVDCLKDAHCDDDLFCNGAEMCVDRLCMVGTIPCTGGELCDEDNDRCVECLTDEDCAGDLVCTDGMCVEQLVCETDADCDDWLYCNGEETCANGNCHAGTPVDCDDGVDCTDDSCNEMADSCDNVPDDDYCDDALFCNGAEACDPQLGCQAGIDPCPGQGCDEENDECVPGWQFIQITSEAEGFDFDCQHPSLHNGQIAFQGSSDGRDIWFWDGTLDEGNQPVTDSITMIGPNGYVASLHDGRIAYEKNDHVYYWPGSGDPEPIPCPGNSEWPELHDRTIAFVTGFSSNYDIHLYDMDSGDCIPIVTTPLVERGQSLCADQVAYPAGATKDPPFDIYLWDGSTTHQITDTPELTETGATLCCNGQLAWQGEDGSATNDYEIYFRADPLDPSTEQQITDNGVYDGEPSCWQGTIAWSAFDGNDYEIFYWDGFSIQQVTDNDVDDREPSLHGGWIAYTSWAGDHARIMLAKPAPSGQPGGNALTFALAVDE
ncbi:MAG: PKD domain-containing protein [Phycisphaerae bacterium]